MGTFFLFYHLWKYLFLWQLDGGAQAGGSETGGLFFPKAIQHIFVGLYIQQICLAALFFLARDQNNDASAVPEGAPYWTHTQEGPDDMPAHIKSSLLGPSLQLPVRDGRLALGTWQGVYLCELRDHGGARSLTVTLQGEA